MARTEAVLEGQNGRRVLLFDVELHDRSGSRLYALCTRNDVVAEHIEKWQLVGLLTAKQLDDELAVDRGALPRGVRSMSPRFEPLRSGKLDDVKRWILRRDRERKRSRYLQIKCVATGNGQRVKRRQNVNVLIVKLSELHLAVRRALEDENCCLIPIVSIDSAKKQQKRGSPGFSVDYFVWIRVSGESVGVVFRGGEPVMALMDRYDITNKALLCDPSFDVDALDRFTSPFGKIRILTDSDYERHLNSNRTMSPSTTPKSIDFVVKFTAIYIDWVMGNDIAYLY